jgi:hypothetical protein
VPSRLAAAELAAALSAIDEANAADPNIAVLDGASGPRAQVQGRRASHWLAQLAPGSDDAVQLAARAHHLRRWTIDRATYPDGRAGYLRWKRDLKAVHRSAIAEVLGPLGVPDGVVQRAGTLVQRVGLGSDPDTQLVEDVACLVFLETQYDDLIDRIGADKVADAVRKTLAKMSAAAIALAPAAVRSEQGAALLAEVAASSR